MATEELCFLPAAELGSLLRQKKLSPVELVEAHLQRTEALEPTLNSFITLLPEEARAEDRRAEEAIQKGDYRGPLHGIPFAVKDVIDTAGIRTTLGCALYDRRLPQEDSTTVTRLREAGAILMGKLNLHTLELGPTGENETYGDMHNPWDVTRHTGGSSGGSASAAAAGECTLTLGTDTGGSIRMPAGLCGVVGLKTTFGRLSLHGLMGLSPTMDHYGPMVRTVEDCALMLRVIAGHDPKDPRSSKVPVPDYKKALTGKVAGLRIGFVKEFFEIPVDPEVKQAVQAALKLLEELGATVVEVSWPMFHYAFAISTAILAADTAGSLRQLVLEHGPEIDTTIRSRIESGLFIPVARYLQAQRARALLDQQSYDLLKQVDILAGPTLPVTAPNIGQREVQVGDTTMPTGLALPQYTRAYNLNGLPAISLPCGFSTSGLPIGLQLAGRAFDEETVLRVAHAYEQATPWHKQHPSLPANTAGSD